jgi:3D-(3,5/4)-trihydroxycyclohexane-1,2-dione acylhydrolase (decyclizing)
MIVGGGVAYADAGATLADFAARTGIPFAETQAGKGIVPFDHPGNLGAIGVTGSAAANDAAAEADLIIGLGTRLQDFTTGSRTLFPTSGCRLVQVNVAPHDAHKHGAETVVGDAGAVLEALTAELPAWEVDAAWRHRVTDAVAAWNVQIEAVTAPGPPEQLPTDAQVLGAVWRTAAEDAIVVCAAGGLPGELHKLWRVRRSGGYHVEYGFSCMGYEIAGGLGAKMAAPDREVHVLVGDGSYLMMNSELATSVMLGRKLIVTLLDNRGFGCIHRLQRAQGGARFNNLLADCGPARAPHIDFAAHARSLGAHSETVSTIAELETALGRARASAQTYVIVIDTDPDASTAAGGSWWDVATPEVSDRSEVRAARAAYDARTGIRDKEQP